MELRTLGSCCVDASCSPKHREVGRGKEARKPKQTEGSYLLGGKRVHEKSTKERGHVGLVSSIGKQIQMACV